MTNTQLNMNSNSSSSTIIGYWQLKKESEGIKAIFDTYYELRLKEYEETHESDDDAWERDLKKEFVCRYHIPNEKKRIRESESLFANVPDNEQLKARSIIKNYMKYARAKRKELYPPNHQANRIIEDTFLDAFRSSGPAWECMSWMRTEYNLPYMGPHWHINGKTEKECLSDYWKEYHEKVIPEYIAEEFEDFDDSVLSVNGGLMDEINENLKNCQTQEDRIRYITTLLQPFKEFADAFDPKARIDERKRSISEHEKWIKEWENMPDDAVDEKTGKSIRPKEQIAACVNTIKKYTQDIAYWEKVQEDFYWFAQHGLGAGDHRTYPRAVNDNMCKYLGGWWECMIQFARRLAALALFYGIKLMDVQEKCEVYLMGHFKISDYVDKKHISSTEQARKLLDEIEAKKTRTRPAKDDSDYEYLKDWQDNSSLDFYLSEEHWNFHVNTLLYKNLLVFHDGREVGAFLDVSHNRVTQPIKDYTSLYGKMFNEAYRLCNTIIRSPVPETKIAQIANQAATWKFKNTNLKDEDGEPITIVPNVIDLIESYHILGMVNAILTLSSLQKNAIDRFLIALSVYKDNGMFFCGFIHRFDCYNILYEAFIFLTIKDGTYLRPGYDYKNRDEYLRKNMPWYENYAIESEKNKQKSEDNEPTNIQEQNNDNCNVFNHCQVTINNLTSTSPNSNKNPNTKKKDKKVKKPIVKPKTLKYYIHGNNGIIAKQQKRVDLVFKKWKEWGWLDNQTTPNDFDALFVGEPRHCNIDFKKNATVLSVFLRDLMRYENRHKKKIISKQTHQSATSLVKEQFGKTENFEEKRLTDDDRFKIMVTLYILDIENPIPLRKGGDDNEYDTEDAAFQEVLSGQLRITKCI